MKFKIKGARLAMLLVPALALTTPTSANVLSDSQEPGSVIVFPKFIQGTVALPEGGTAPITELEIGVVCPKGVICPEHEPIKLRLHWVCGATEADAATSFVCKETDFDVNATVFEKIVLTPNGEPIGTYGAGLPNHFSPAANCPQGGGYLIAWVINPANDKPIKFDGLIGDAVLRVSGTAEAGYDAIPIQADPGLANGAAVTTNGNGALIFDGNPGHYTLVTGQVMGDVRYENVSTPPTFTTGFLTLLTLDVKSNRPNNPVFVDLDFFGGNPSAIGNENQLSTSTDFICWEEIRLYDISLDLTTTVMGRKGVFVSAPAVDTTGTNVTLLGLSETREGSATAFPLRENFSGLFNPSVGVPTKFVPTPSPNFLP
jgi:hypothetical protein